MGGPQETAKIEKVKITKERTYIELHRDNLSPHFKLNCIVEMTYTLAFTQLQMTLLLQQTG
jgi:hypothetical protein